jgi:hypothetical protein
MLEQSEFEEFAEKLRKWGNQKTTENSDEKRFADDWPDSKTKIMKLEN